MTATVPPAMRALALLPALLGLAAAVPAAAQPAPSGPLPVRFHVAEVEGSEVVSAGWLAEQLETANELFAPAAVSFVQVEPRTLPEAHATVLTRRQRHDLSPRVEPGVINVFVVDALADVDVEGRFLRGVHWRSRSTGERHHYVILSKISAPSILAHELGHFFGNGHSDVPGNIMSYDRGDVPPFFDEEQLRRIRFSARRFLRRGELDPALVRP